MVIVKGGGLMVSESVAVADVDALSVTFTVKLDDPGAVGSPEIEPLDDKFNPTGKEPPAIDHVYGGDPPATPSICEYARPAVPAGRDDVVIVSGGGLIVNETAAASDLPVVSATFTVKLADPAVAGVPEIVPAADKLNPAGRDPAVTDHV